MSLTARTVDVHVAARLIAARKAADLSQEQAADHLGVTFQQLQKYEKARNRISAGKLLQLAQLYRRDIGWFFEGLPANGERPIPDLGSALVSSACGADLARSFVKIASTKKRRLVVDLAESLS